MTATVALNGCFPVELLELFNGGARLRCFEAKQNQVWWEEYMDSKSSVGLLSSHELETAQHSGAVMSGSSKKSSYPSRQLRGGPAPLASFEDLSDEIESPEYQSADPYDPGAMGITPDRDTEDDVRTYSDGATPSTPRVLAQTPSTPMALDDFSAAGTPNSMEHSLVFDVDATQKRPETPAQGKDTTAATSSSRGSLFSPRSSPLFGRRCSKSRTPEPSSESSTGGPFDKKSNEHLQIGGDVTKTRHSSGAKSGPGTPSPRSARKLFTMSFFKPREDKTPSPMASPKSPGRQLSPSIMPSPKSPRKSSQFVAFFKGSSGKDTGEATDPSASPTKKRSHFSNFLRPSKDERKLTQDFGSSGGDHGRKEGRHGVFATLFRREHRDGGGNKSMVSPVDHQPPMGALSSDQTLGDDNWRHSPADYSKLPAAPIKPAHSSWETSEPIPPTITEQPEMGAELEAAWQSIMASSPVPSDKISIPSWSDIRISKSSLENDKSFFESAHDLSSNNIPVSYDPSLRLGLSPSVDVGKNTPSAATGPSAEMFSDTGKNFSAPDATTVASEVADVTRGAIGLSVDDKMSPESDVEMPDADPTVLKQLKGDEPEAENLLREDSFETDDFAGLQPSPGVAVEAGGMGSRPEDSVIQSRDQQLSGSRHRDRIASFRTNPVDRPRSTAPINFSSLEAYINIVAPSSAGSATDVPSSSEKVSKLKVVLPGEEFEPRSTRQSKKSVYKSWSEFCEVGLQSPRSRRRQVVNAAMRPFAASVPASRETTIEEEDKRAESLDYGFVSSTEFWATFDPAATSFKPGECDVTTTAAGGIHSFPDGSSTLPAESVPSHADGQWNIRQEGFHRSSSDHSSSCSSGGGGNASPPPCKSPVVLTTFLRDEEVEPLVLTGSISNANLVRDGDDNEDDWDNAGSICDQMMLGDSAAGEKPRSSYSGSIPECVSSMIQSQPYPLPHPEVISNFSEHHYQQHSCSSVSVLEDGDGDHQSARWSGERMDLLASLPSPKQEQPKWHSSDLEDSTAFVQVSHVENGHRHSGNSLATEEQT